MVADTNYSCVVYAMGRGPLIDVRYYARQFLCREKVPDIVPDIVINAS